MRKFLYNIFALILYLMLIYFGYDFVLKFLSFGMREISIWEVGIIFCLELFAIFDLEFRDRSLDDD